MNANTKLRVFNICVVLSLAACSSTYPPRDNATMNGINQQLKQAATPREKAAAPVLPDAVNSFLLPPVRKGAPRTSSRQLEQRFDLVIKDGSLDQLLMSIVHDTPYSIMVKPKSAIATLPGTVTTPATPTAGSTDRVTINLKDVTLFEALDAIREVYGYDYTVEGNRIYVQQPELQTQLYQVNYIIGQRRGVSDMQVIGGASPSSNSSSGGTGTGGSTGAAGSGSGASSSYASVQATGLSSISKSDLWGEVEDTVRTTLGCEIFRSQGAGAAASTGSNSKASRADVSFVGDAQAGERNRGVSGCPAGRGMSINQMSGTILIRGMPNDHRTIRKMLHSLQLNIERQVIIEAKIIEVALNAGSQQGINWASFNSYGQHRYSMGANASTINSTSYTQTTQATLNNPGITTTTPGGTVIGGTSLGSLLGTGALATNALASGLGAAIQFPNFMAMINFMQTQGNVHVLSSPRIATLNNQKAVLKVGSEEPFVTNASGGSTTPGIGGAQPTFTSPTITYQPFFSGIALDVTPQIDDRGNITLHVHSMVNTITTKDKVAIVGATGNTSLPFAVNGINETDSVIKTSDGRVVVIGGLMTENSLDNRAKIPVAGDVPALGAFFSNGDQSKSKRELVILLKTTIVKDDGTWTDDIAAAQARIESLGMGNQTQAKDH